MLVLSRREEESLVLEYGHKRITFTVLAISPYRVKIGIEAPREVVVLRDELLHQKPQKAKPKPKFRRRRELH